MANVIPNHPHPFNNPQVGGGVPPSPGKPYAAMDTAHAEAVCGTRVVGKLERLATSLENMEKANEEFRTLLEELDRKLGMALPSPDAQTVCGSVSGQSPTTKLSLESCIAKVQSQEDRTSRNVARLRGLIRSL